MEIGEDNVLRQFTRLCNTDFALLQHYLASNAVLEWFGRTIRGRTNICAYYRYDLCQQYEHDFEKAEKCPAFECKPSHMQTRIVAEIDKVNSQIESQSLTTDTLTSTPLQRIVTPTLPKVGKEKIFITTPEISPTFSTSLPEDNTTPPQNITRHGEQEDEAPPTKKTRFDNSLDCAGDAGPSKKKKYMQKFTDKSDCDTKKLSLPEVGHGDGMLSSQEIQDMQLSDTGYSDLMYFESVGFLRSQNKSKYHGISNAQTSSGNNSSSPVTSSSLPNDLTNMPHMRKTKLKLSYRIRRHDNQLQIALIIYEHLSRNPASRRNLLQEFQKTTDDNGIPNTKPSVSQSAKKPMKSLKRSLRLF